MIHNRANDQRACGRGTAKVRRRRSMRPTVMALEDRRLLATFTVTSTGYDDSHGTGGSGRATGDCATIPRTIDFNIITPTTITPSRSWRARAEQHLVFDHDRRPRREPAHPDQLRSVCGIPGGRGSHGVNLGLDHERRYCWSVERRYGDARRVHHQDTASPLAVALAWTIAERRPSSTARSLATGLKTTPVACITGRHRHAHRLHDQRQLAAVTAAACITRAADHSQLDCTISGNTARTAGRPVAKHRHDEPHGLHGQRQLRRRGLEHCGAKPRHARPTRSSPATRDRPTSAAMRPGSVTGSYNLIGTGGSGGITNGVNGNIVLDQPRRPRPGPAGQLRRADPDHGPAARQPGHRRRHRRRTA